MVEFMWCLDMFGRVHVWLSYCLVEFVCGRVTVVSWTPVGGGGRMAGVHVERLKESPHCVK